MRLYSLVAQPAGPEKRDILSSEFRDHLEQLSNELISAPDKSPSYADFLSEKLVQQFGTHYVYSVDAGSALAKTDHTDVMQPILEFCATTSFLNYFRHPSQHTKQCHKEFTLSYQHSLSYSKVQSAGGKWLSPGMSISDWSETVNNNLVAVDQKGDTLDTLVRSNYLPYISLPILALMRMRIRKAIRRYFEANSIRGCMDFGRNFDRNANLHDKSMCTTRDKGLFLEGVYQTCQQSLPHMESDSKKGHSESSQQTIPSLASFCKDLNNPNHQTKEFSCPRNSETVHLLETTKKVCQADCSREAMTSCPQVCRVLQLNSFYCTVKRPPSTFGGIYAAYQHTLVTNPLTQSYSCPVGFRSHRFTSANTIICMYSLSDTQNSRDISESPTTIQFGGFFSCSRGNFYAGNEAGCPGGYSPRLAFVQEGCEVFYCIKSKQLASLEVARLRYPPYTHITTPSRHKLNPERTKPSLLNMMNNDRNKWFRRGGVWKLGRYSQHRDYRRQLFRMI